MTNPTSMSLPLADIHLQAAPGIWPLAWGWWAVIAAVLSILVVATVMIRAFQHKRRARNEALSQLASLETLAAVNELLKRAALSYFNRETVAGLTGNGWLAFLDTGLPASQKGFVASASLWQKGTFSKEGLNESELAVCKSLAGDWLKHALPPKKQALREANHV
ncbi:DUF4381 domain-containing protein [Parasalinivibrio latis]|uniref:DUF4381 domain-containing protein n=1 Tax=Parasalinivibrio latis TaxID=2952610 RepID=UPI0030DF8902